MWFAFQFLSILTVTVVIELNQTLPVKSTHLRKFLPSGMRICLFDCFGESVYLISYLTWILLAYNIHCLWDTFVLNHYVGYTKLKAEGAINVFGFYTLDICILSVPGSEFCDLLFSLSYVNQWLINLLFEGSFLYICQKLHGTVTISSDGTAFVT